MIGLALVRPLEDDWRDTLDAVAAARGWPTSRDPAKLGKRVAELSAAYNDPARGRATMREAGAARLGFSFPRDVPKAAAAVRELLATGVLGVPEGGTLRVLDLGAGLGASTWGVVRALEAAGARGTVEATWVDADADALQVASAVVRERQRRESGVMLRVRTAARSAASGFAGLPRHDLVLAGQLLSELDVRRADGTSAALPRRGQHLTSEEERALQLAENVGSWLEQLTLPSGSLVVIEPALRDRTRVLHRVRDALVGRDGVTLFAPCLHSAPSCPALAREADWCHEDVPVDLPGWLTPVVRAAGLRHEGLTFSYLVLRRDGVRLRDLLHVRPGDAVVRAVSNLLRSKGKLEAFLCGELPGTPQGARARVMRLDRDAGPANVAWESAARGELLSLGSGSVESGRGEFLRVAGDVRAVQMAAPAASPAESR